MFSKIILTIVLLSGFYAVAAQTEWELAKDKNGIKVYTAKEANSKFKSVKVEARLAGTLQKLTDVLLDVNNIKKWVFSTKESYALKKISTYEILYYNETSLPWPVSNRDVPIQMKLTADFENNTLKVVSTGVPQAIPIKKGIVRVPELGNSWDVKYDGKNTLFITYLLSMDPGGSIPPAITNMFMTKGPFETFTNLAERLK